MSYTHTSNVHVPKSSSTMMREPNILFPNALYTVSSLGPKTL